MIEVIGFPAANDATASPPQALGQIRVGEFAETFLMSLTCWTVDDYRSSWDKAMRRLEGARDATSCLVASITDPAVTNFLPCWPMYRDGNDVYVQNSIIFLDQLDEPFDVWEPWRYVEARQSVDEDGNRISQWATSVSEVRRFRESTGRRY